MPHAGDHRPWAADDAAAILAARAFATRLPLGASATTVVDEANLVLAQRTFATQRAAAQPAAVSAVDAATILALRTFIKAPAASSSSSSSPSTLTSYPKGAAWPGGGAIILGTSAVVVRCTPCQAAGLIVEAEMEGDGGSGSATVEVWKVASGASPATAANKISGSSPITITAGTNSLDTTLTGWTKTIALGDRIAFKLLTVSGFTWLRASIKVAT